MDSGRIQGLRHVLKHEDLKDDLPVYIETPNQGGLERSGGVAVIRKDGEPFGLCILRRTE